MKKLLWLDDFRNPADYVTGDYDITWVKKYDEFGEAGLEDRRGKRKAEQEPRTELEEMKIKMAKLEHELYRTKVERDLLKKLEGLERRDAFRK